MIISAMHVAITTPTTMTATELMIIVTCTALISLIRPIFVTLGHATTNTITYQTGKTNYFSW